MYTIDTLYSNIVKCLNSMIYYSNWPKRLYIHSYYWWLWHWIRLSLHYYYWSLYGCISIK